MHKQINVYAHTEYLRIMCMHIHMICRYVYTDNMYTYTGYTYMTVMERAVLGRVVIQCMVKRRLPSTLGHFAAPYVI